MKPAVFFVEPFYSGSHRAFADGFKQHVKAEVTLFTLSGNHWKWRMHGGAITLAQRVNAGQTTPELILATDMLDIALFKSLLDKRLAHVPVVLYFHENQLAYPWSPDDADKLLERDNHYKFINYSSALCADRVWFNSHYNYHSFFDALPDFLKRFPDFQNTETVAAIKQKSSVLPLGLDLSRFDKYKKPKINKVPVVLWNHRWEFDKNPKAFFDTLWRIKQKEVPFKLIVLGERFKKSPECFDTAHSRFKEELIHMGFVPDFSEYARLLWQSDILPVTSNQDFFGISTLEAMYCGVTPVLPNRLAFPEHLSAKLGALYYDAQVELDKLVSVLLTKPERREDTSEFAAKYDWKNMSLVYDLQIDALIHQK